MGNVKRTAMRIVGKWQNRLQDNYDDLEEWEGYSDTYGLAERLGFGSAAEAWEANPMIQGSTDPNDLKIVEPAAAARDAFDGQEPLTPEDPLTSEDPFTPEDLFTPEQREKVDAVLGGIRTQVAEGISREAPGIREMAPDGLPHVAQGMLEELIEKLKELV